MKTVKTPIISIQPIFAKIEAPHEIHKEAICLFAATGFFLDRDTYWKDEVVLPPACINTLSSEGYLEDSSPWFEWHYSPREISFEQALEEFTNLFESILEEQTLGQRVILPLSGGLDSRTQAVAFRKLNKGVTAYSYSFQDGYPESSIGKKIAKICGYSFKEFVIPQGYLWQEIDHLAEINGCFSEFTHPRQMAVLEEFYKMEGVFSLGHWGDVLFDKGANEAIASDDMVAFIVKKIVKKGGMELGTALWDEWKLDGNFDTYLKERIIQLLDRIAIENTSAKLRAFKSLYWAPRWTSVNLAIFQKAHPVTLPYYDNRMCQFICTLPEAFLADRRLQIAYIKKCNADLAKLTWEEKKPFNLYTYSYNKVPWNVPYRMVSKMQRTLKKWLGKPYIQRNWELQFSGADNDAQLAKALFARDDDSFISHELKERFYNNFKSGDGVKYAHPLSMLLTLSVWERKFFDV